MSSKIAPLKIRKENIPYKDISFNMVEIEGGSFLLSGKIKTKISNFQLGQHLVSQVLWEEIMGENPSYWKGKDRPVENITWYDCIAFCNELSRRLRLEPYYVLDKNRKDPYNKSEYDDLKYFVRPIPGANGYRLPTEAEWEFAAKGGALKAGFAYAGSEELKKVGWYNGNSFRKTHAHGLKLPNELGLYDMSGNIWEWCWDWYGSFPKQSLFSRGPLKDPQGPKSGDGRVLRGGSWDRDAEDCGVAIRNRVNPGGRDRDYGLRLSRTAL